MSKIRYDNQDPGMSKHPASDGQLFSVEIIGAPTNDSFES